MTVNDSFLLPDLAPLPGDERIEEIDALLTQATEEGVVPELPATEEEVLAKPQLPGQVLSARTWLYLLGYLRKRQLDVPEIDNPLRRAIREFQTEAQLEVDGWIGEQTWSALQQLVSFEAPIELDRWFESNGAPTPALERSVKARLHVLGFCRSRQPRSPSRVRRALKRFAIIAEMLGLAEGRLMSAIVPATVRVLFDQDRILERLGQAGNDFSTDRRGRKFVICVAKVELFLHGFDIHPDGNARFDCPDQKIYPTGRYPLYHAMRSFWQGLGVSDSEARVRALKVTGQLFRELAALDADPVATSGDADLESLVSAVEAADEGEKRRIWNRLQRLGARIWDGMRRAFRWMRKLLGRGLRKVAGRACNIARLLGHHAGRIAAAMKKILAVLKETVAFLFEDELAGSDPEQIVIRKEGLDFDLFIVAGADPERVRSLVDRFQEQAERFALAVRIVGLLVATVIDVAKKVALGGWLGLLVALVKIVPRAREMMDQLLAAPVPASGTVAGF